MNLVFLGIIIFIVLALILSSFAKANTQKISKNIRFLIVVLSIILGIIFFLATSGKFIVPQLLNILKVGLPFLTKFIGI